MTGIGNNMIGKFARSIAGHDKGKAYVIIAENGKNVTLADGRLKTIKKPKVKNIKHIEIMNRECDASLRTKIISGDKSANEGIKQAIKLYNREEENV